ncbi:MAG TPA: hypothetical protein VGF24_17170 [Vicinamibacterales bacterium]|jgi:hypothetical protein
MRSIADDLRRDTMRRVAQLSVTERIALALRLGDEDVAQYRAARGVNDADARRALKRARALGRQPSRSNDAEAV